MAYYQFRTEVLEEGTPEEYGSFEVFYISTSGWYWWACFPGCLPDSEAWGPFDTEQAAINDARGD